MNTRSAENDEAVPQRKFALHKELGSTCLQVGETAAAAVPRDPPSRCHVTKLAASPAAQGCKRATCLREMGAVRCVKAAGLAQEVRNAQSFLMALKQVTDL